MSQPIQGVFCPHMVPLDHAGRINESELRRMIDFLIEAGISGLYPNGSTGEFTRFNEKERRRVIEIVMEQTNKAGRDVPVLAGAAEANIDETVDTLNYYADLGARAGALIAPYYYKMSQESIQAYFEELAERSRLDIILYNIPQFANGITIETIVALCGHPRIVGIKDSERDLPRFLNTMHAVKPLRPDFCFLIGCEEILLPSLIMGADGGTVATSGVMPEMIMKLYNLFREGRIEEAKAIQFQMLDLIKVMLVGPDFPEGFRAGMRVRGFEMGKGRMHRSAAKEVDIARITNVIQCMIAEHGLVSPPPGGCPLPGMPTAAGGEDVDAETVQEIVARVMSQLGR